MFASLISIGDTDADRIQAGEDIQLGEGQFCHPVDPHRVPEQDGIQPADSAGAPGCGSVLIPWVTPGPAQALGKLAFDLCWKWMPPHLPGFERPS